MVKKSALLVSMVAIFSIILTGCGLSMGPKKQLTPIKVEYTSWFSDYTLLVGVEKGIFARHNLQVDPVYYSTYDQVMPDLASSRIDVGLLSMGDVLTGSRVTDLRALAVTDSGGTLRVMARPEIKEVADLKGKNIGIPSGLSGEMVVRQMLQTAGLSPKDVTLITIEPEAMAGRLSAGDVSAGFVWKPWDQKALEAGQRVLFEIPSVPPLFPNLIVFREDVIQDRPEDTRAFIQAWFEALEYRQAHPDEANAIIARLTNQKVEDLAGNNEVKLFSLADNQKMFDKANASASSVYHSAKMNLDFSILRGDVTFPPDLNALFDSSYLN